MWSCYKKAHNGFLLQRFANRSNQLQSKYKAPLQALVPQCRTGEGMCMTQENSLHAANKKQSIGNGRKGRIFKWKLSHRTSKRTSVESLGSFCRPWSPWSDMLWNDSFAQQSPGWLQHTLYAHCTCEQALLQTACHVWLLHYRGCHWYEWIPTPSFFLRSSDKIHLSEVTPLMKVCGKVCRHPWTKLIHTECKMCRSLHLNSNLFNCVYSNWIFIFQQVPCSLQRDQ